MDLIQKWNKRLESIENTVKTSNISKSSEFEHKSNYILIQEFLKDLKDFKLLEEHSPKCG